MRCVLYLASAQACPWRERQPHGQQPAPIPVLTTRTIQCTGRHKPHCPPSSSSGPALHPPEQPPRSRHRRLAPVSIRHTHTRQTHPARHPPFPAEHAPCRPSRLSPLRSTFTYVPSRLGDRLASTQTPLGGGLGMGAPPRAHPSAATGSEKGTGATKKVSFKEAMAQLATFPEVRA